MRIWESAAGQEITTLQGHSEPIHEVVFAPHRNQVVSASGDGSVKVWDASSEREIKGHGQAISGCCLYAQGDSLVTASRDATISIWNVSANNEPNIVQTFDKRTSSDAIHSKSINALAVSPDGARFTTGSDDNTVKIWSTHSSRCVATLAGHTQPVRSLSYSPDGKFVASASWDRSIRIWDASSGLAINTLQGIHQDWIDCVAYSPDGQLLASAGHDKFISFCNPYSCMREFTLNCSAPGWINALAFSPDSKLLATAQNEGGIIVLWNVKRRVEEIQLDLHEEGKVNCVTFSPDSKLLVSGGQDRTVRVTRVKDYASISQFHCRAPVTCIYIVGEKFVVGDSLGNVYLFELENHKHK